MMVTKRTRTLTTKASKINVGDFLITGKSTGFPIVRVDYLDHGPFGAVMDVRGPGDLDRIILYGDRNVMIERYYED